MLKSKNISTATGKGNHKRVHHRNISFDVSKGEILLLLGRNGIGKSVLLKSLMGLIPLNGGEIWMNNKLIDNKNKDRSRYFSLLLSQTPQIELMTADEVASTSKNWDIDKNNLETLYCKFNIEHLKNQAFSTLSEGEKQKFMLARSLNQKSSVILMDEPTSYLDYSSKREFWNFIKNECKQQQKAAIIITHDIEVALPYASKVLILENENYQWIEDPNNINIPDLF